MILRYLVALPCYNNSDTVEQVILDVLSVTPFPVLVIDDGSDTSVESHLKDAKIFAARESGRLHFVKHSRNLGKGEALQTAFQWALQNNITHVFTCDTDGQHLAREIKKMIERSRNHPWSLVIGSRKWQMNVPSSSKFGRQFSNFWVKFETGYRALDSQSGFRIYPLFHVQGMNFFTTKYDFEIEVLIRLLWKHVDVQEVDIEVHYPNPDERVSHFNKFSDNVRISLLNSVLVIVSLLRGHLEPAKSGFALGFGVLIGMTPFFGIHTLMVAGAALAFRLNFLLLLIGSQVSLPIFVPFVAASSIHVGHWLMTAGGAPLVLKMPETVHQAFSMSKTFFVEWLVGSLVLGALLGTALGSFYYFIKKWFLRKSKQTWTGQTRGGAFGNWFLKNILKHMGIKAGYFCLYFIVPYFYIFAPRARKSLNQYWQNIFPEMTWAQRQKEILKHFYTFGQVLMDRVYQSYHEELVFKIHRDGPVYIDQVVQSGRGWVFIGAHLGGWDISSLFFKKDPRSARLGMVHFLSENGLTFDKVLKRGTESAKVDSIQSGGGEGTLITVKSFLDDNRHVGFLADRAIGTQIELIPFLGKLAAFETRPFRVAAACRAPLIFTYNFKSKESDYSFLTTNHSELAYNAHEDRRVQVFQWTETFVRDLEVQLKKYPHQWFNFYPFWSSLPKEIEGATIGRQENSLLEELSKQPTTSTDQAPSKTTSAEPKY